MNRVERSKARSLKRRSVERLNGLSDNQVAAMMKKPSDDFMRSAEWFMLKAQTIARYGCVCMKCKRGITRWMDINVDHIKPRKYFPDLRNDPENLQILCGRCNKEKGNHHDTDYRKSPIPNPPC